MEDRLFFSLALQPDGRLLDSGCVLVTSQCTWPARVCSSRPLTSWRITIGGQIKASRQQDSRRLLHPVMGHHHLDAFADQTFDGVYKMETLVHTTDPGQVLQGFSRMMKPEASIALHEYERADSDTLLQDGPTA